MRVAIKLMTDPRLKRVVVFKTIIGTVIVISKFLPEEYKIISDLVWLIMG